MNKFLARGLAAAALVGAAVPAVGRLNAAPPASKDGSQFAPALDFNKECDGNVVLFYQKASSGSSTIMLAEARLVSINGHEFVYGKGYAPTGDDSSWHKGLRIGAAWDQIESFFILTPEQAKNLTKHWESSVERQ